MVVRNSMVTRIIAVLIGIQFVASGIPSNALALKAKTARAKGTTVFDVADSLDKQQKDGGTRDINEVLILSNIVSLREGARTGGYNVEHAKADKANGAIFNHSEPRAELENKMKNLLLATRDLAHQKARPETYFGLWNRTLQTENLSEDVIKQLLANVLVDFLDNPRSAEAVDTTARTLVNNVINANLKKWISKGPFEQTVLCAGETLEQYKAGRTNEIILQDLQEMLEGITTAQAKSINLRIAYEPRWAIGTGLTPTSDEIQATHRYIKGVVRPLIDGIEVDYGGSLKPENAVEILALPDVNGGLIGGAAKDPAVLGKVIDTAVDLFEGKFGAKKSMILNIGGNWKAEDAATKLADFDAFGAMLKTKDLAKVRVAFGTPRVAAIQPAAEELNQYLAKSSPEAEALVTALAKNLGDEAKRAEALAKIEAVSQDMKDFTDLFLIQGKGQIDAEQLAALKSRIRKEKDPEIAPKRDFNYGSDSVARLAAREITANGYDNLELVAVIGKANEELFPFMVRDSQQGVFPGRAEAPNKDFMYLGKQPEAVRVFSDQSFVNVVDNLPWKALALDAIIIDEGMFGKLNAAQLAKLEGIQLVVSRASGEGFITYIPGLSDEAEVQKEAKISAAASDATAVTMAVETMKSFGQIATVTTDVIEAGKGQVPSTYRIESAYQTVISLTDRFKSVLARMGFGDNENQQTGTYQLRTQVSHGQLVMVGVVMKTENLDKKKVLAAFNKLAAENEAVGIPEKWVKMTSNIVWGEKRAFFSPDDLYIKTFPGGSYVSMLFLVDEDTANVDTILRAIAGKSSIKQAAAQKAEAKYAESQIIAKLEAQKKEKDAKDKADKAAKSAARVAAVKKARKAALAHPTDLSSETIKTLFGEDVRNVQVLTGADNKPVGLFAVDEQSTIRAVNLLTPKSLDATQATLAAYYTALRDVVLGYAFLSSEAGNSGVMEVLDVYRPEAQLRVRFSVSIHDPKKTTFNAVEELTKGAWKTIAEPNTVLDPVEFVGKIVMAINGAGGNIGSAELEHLSAEDRNNVRVIAIGGPEAELLGAFYLRRDPFHGPFQGTIETGKDWIELNGRRSIIFSSRDSKAFREPENYPWGAFIFAGVPINLVSDATGNFLTVKGLNLHRQAGALRSYATAPGDKEDAEFKTATFVMNRNEGNYDPNKHFVGSNASCTTGNIGQLNAGVKNGVAKALGLIPPEVLEKANALVESARQYFTGTTNTLAHPFWSGIVQTTRKAMVDIQKKVGFNMFGYTDHALTDEALGPDKPAALKKQSRARGASENIFPTTTGFKDAIGQVDVGVDADGLAIRFPTDVGSLGVGTYFVEGTISKEDILWGLYLHAAVSKGVTVAHIPASGQIKVDPELRTNMAVISPDMLEVKHFENAQGKPMTMVKLTGWYQNVFYYALEIADFYDKVIGAKEGPSIVTMTSDGRLSTGAVKVANVPLITDLPRESLKSAKVLMRVDFNVSDKSGNIKNDRRLRAELDYIKYIMDSGVDYAVIEAHNNKPKGKVVPAFSMQKPAQRLQELLPGYKVVFHPESVDVNGVAAGARQKMVKGAINVIENTRFCPGDEANDPVFSRDLAALVDNDMFVFDGFGAGERVHASTAGAAAFVNRIAVGQLVDKEVSSMKTVLENLYLIGLGGGPKLEEKVPAVENGVDNLKPGGGIVTGSAPSVAFYKAMHNIEFGQKPSEGNVQAAGKIAEKVKAKGGTVFLPVDFAGTTVDLDAKVPGTEKSWLESQRLPEGARVYNLRLDVDRKKLVDKDTGKEFDTKDVFIYDAQQDYEKIANSIPKGGTMMWNGSMGVSEMPQFAKGTMDFANALAKVSKNADNPDGVFTDIVGDDTGLAVDQAGVADKMTHISTGGGASLGLMAGKKLKAIRALEQIQGNVVTAKSIGIKPTELVSLRASGEIVSAARVGSFLADYTKGVRAFLRNSDVMKSSRALILGPEFFRDATSLDAAKNIASLSKLGIKVAIFGENGKADKVRDIVGNNDIIVGNTENDVVAELMAIGIKPEQMMKVVPGDNKTAAEALVEAVTKLIGAKEVNDLFAGFTSGMASLTKDVSEDVQKAEAQFAAIMDKV